MVLSTLRGALTRYPLLKSIVTVTTLIGSADICCQFLEKKNFHHFDFARFRNMITIGVAYYGPLYYYYYGFLDRKLPGTNPRTVLLKLLIDQVVVTIPSLLVFYVFMGQLEGKTIGDTKTEIRLKFLPTYATACMFWPTVQCINFALVPPAYRVLCVSGSTFVWLTFLSYIKNRPKLPAIFERIEAFTSSKTTATTQLVKRD